MMNSLHYNNAIIQNRPMKTFVAVYKITNHCKINNFLSILDKDNNANVKANIESANIEFKRFCVSIFT